MCYNCYKEYGSPKVISDKVRDAVELVTKYDSASYCGLHIVVDDWNLEDEHVVWCLKSISLPEEVSGLTERSEEEKTAIVELGTLLLIMTIAERATALAINEGYVCLE